MFVHYHPKGHIIGDYIEGVKTKSSFKYLASCAFVSEIKPMTIDEALIDDKWIIVMEKILHQFTINNIWTHVPKP